MSTSNVGHDKDDWRKLVVFLTNQKKNKIGSTLPFVPLSYHKHYDYLINKMRWHYLVKWFERSCICFKLLCFITWTSSKEILLAPLNLCDTHLIEVDDKLASTWNFMPKYYYKPIQKYLQLRITIIAYEKS